MRLGCLTTFFGRMFNPSAFEADTQTSWKAPKALDVTAFLLFSRLQYNISALTSYSCNRRKDTIEDKDTISFDFKRRTFYSKKDDLEWLLCYWVVTFRLSKLSSSLLYVYNRFGYRARRSQSLANQSKLLQYKRWHLEDRESDLKVKTSDTKESNDSNFFFWFFSEKENIPDDNGDPVFIGWNFSKLSSWTVIFLSQSRSDICFL